MSNMDNKEIFDEASLSEGGGTAVGGDGGSSTAQTSANETPSVCPADSQLPQEGAYALHQPECEDVGGDVLDAPSTDSIPSERKPWYVDLTRDEFIAFRMLTARLMGPLRQRIPMLVVSIVCFVATMGFAIFEWLTSSIPYPDPVLVVGALLVLIPALILCVYVPQRMKKQAGKQYDRSVQAGMDFCGELFIYPDCIEKASSTVTASVRFDERMLFIETAEMMVITAIGSPAIVLPARCLTEEMARAVRQAAERIPPRNRRFIARVKARGEVVAQPEPRQKPEELWVQTFTYTAEEYAVVLKGIIQQHFWRMSPVLALVAMMGSIVLGNGDITRIVENIPLFVVIMVLLVLFNLVLPLRRVKTQTESLSAHDLTMQVRMDTMALRVKLPKGGENWVLWCDVDHVYEREDFVEVVHNKNASLYIPKRVIEDLDALDAVIKRCRGEQQV